MEYRGGITESFGISRWIRAVWDMQRRGHEIS